jgi:hypothetical protein
MYYTHYIEMHCLVVQCKRWDHVRLEWSIKSAQRVQKIMDRIEECRVEYNRGEYSGVEQSRVEYGE